MIQDIQLTRKPIHDLIYFSESILDDRDRQKLSKIGSLKSGFRRLQESSYNFSHNNNYDIPVG